ncbi:MAG TPA: DoxX family protein [Saprospiraceae bacterium]|nr:DoxX family protein [Saprospiraceae bacterium]HPI06320.1 DoxX family protein [Saprospiraceae bacterium]
MRDITDLIGRIFLSAIFLFEAFDTMLYFDKTRLTMEQYGLTSNQDFLLYSTVFLLLAGGLMVLLGYRSTLGALMLLMYWVPVTFMVHDFWHAPKDQMRMQSILFMKDIAIIGGLLMVVGKGSGRYSMRRLLATTRVN